MNAVSLALCTATEESVSMMRRVEGCHKALNEHIKNWKCLGVNFDVKGNPMKRMDKYSAFFPSYAIMKQVSMQIMDVRELYKVQDEF